MAASVPVVEAVMDYDDVTFVAKFCQYAVGFIIGVAIVAVIWRLFG